ncbi:hypothetical protein BGW36DRAFT_370188, partial [Talaromyces proteolyticus]
MNMPRSAKRSACDLCRAKRVRCPRAEDSTAPCARCIHVGARCVTGSPGYPGRPRKARLIDGTTPRNLAMTSADDSASPVSWPTQRDGNHVELQTPPVEEPISVNMNMPIGWSGADTASLNPLDGLGGVGHSDFWTTSASTNFFDCSLTDENPVLKSIPTQVQQSRKPSQQQELLSASDTLDMMYTGQAFNNILDVDSFLYSSESLSDQSSPVQCLSAVSLLMRFQEKMEQHVTTMGAFFSEPRNVVEDCKEKDSMSMDTENPVAVVLMCTKEFIDIIQSLATATQHATSDSSTRSELVQPNAAPWITRTKSLSTETTLLVLSSYLALMKLYDSLFHGVYHCFCQMPSEVIKSIKVKEVFRIGGISSLQDIPVKVYAMGIVDVIQNQIKALERCMGLPAAYCLSSEVTASQSIKGLFANGDRAQLFRIVMEQQDVKSQGGNKSYVESIRENIKNSVAYFD